MPSFLNVLFLAGLAGAALPLAIHLLSRDRPRQLDFGWFRFLDAAHRAQARRFQLRHLLLMLMRMLVCALLALAFARPFFADAAPDDSAIRLPAYVVVVADVSYSMRNADWFARAQRRILDIADEREPGDQVALLAVSNRARTAAGWTDELEHYRSAARQLSPTFETADLGAAFRAAEEMLRGVAAERRVLYVISDHQEKAWQRLDRGDRAAQGIEVVLENVAVSGRDNVVVADVQAAGSRGDAASVVALVVRVHNYGETDVNRLPLQLAIDDEIVASRRVDIAAGHRTDTVFDLPEGLSRELRGWVQIQADDLKPDNRRYFVVHPPHRYRVLCVDGAAPESHGASYFLTRALHPWTTRRGNIAAPRIIHPRALSPTALRDRDVVFLYNVAGLTAAAQTALGDFVRRGGGLVVAADDRGLPSLEALLPAATSRAARALPTREGFAIFTDIDFAHPLFAPFQVARRGDFGTAQTFSYAVLEEPAEARVLMRFDDGHPALVEHQLEAGRILLFATSFDTRWTDLPKRALFPPFIHEMVSYLAGGDDKARASLDDFTVDDYLTIADVPEKADVSEAADASRPTASTVAVPGIYTVDLPGGRRTVAVNVDWTEGDLRAADLAELTERLSPLAADDAEVPAAKVELAQVEDEELEHEQGIWWFVMIAVLALALGEMFLANRL